MCVRYAPSPTGVLHVGNFRTAVIAQAWAQFLGLPLVFRYEDNDRDRSRTEFLEAQKRDFRALSIVPDQEMLQSDFLNRHFELFRAAAQTQAVYPCFSSRKEVAEGIASAPHGAVSGPLRAAAIYDGKWRDRQDYPSQSAHPTVSWRFRNSADDGSQDFIVARTPWHGDVPSDVGDFMAAYNWACAVDDYDLQPALLVRAWDLESVFEPQRKLQELFARLEKSTFVWPAIFYCGLVTDESGHRLEKRSQSVTLADLQGRGIEATAVGQKLRQSFAENNLRQITASESFGEIQRQIRISEIGF